MTLKQTIEEIKTWSITEQVEFCNRVTKNITIGVRSILSYNDVKESEKLEAIKWLNEFHHRIDNLKIEIKDVISSSNRIEEHAKYYASKNKLAGGEIAAIIRSSYEAKIRDTKRSPKSK